MWQLSVADQTQMENLHNLKTAELMDLLAEHTAVITKLFSEKNLGEEYEKRKMLVKAIQTEIDFRKTQVDLSTNITSLPDFIT